MKQRIEYIDLAKGFCILLVVVYHIFVCYNVQMPLNNFFKSFRLPLYFFLSGMFFKEYAGFLNFTKRKINKLIVPFAFWFLLISVFLDMFLHNLGISIWGNQDETGIVRRLFGWMTAENFPNSPIWFLLCLFEVNMLFYLCLIISKRSPKYKKSLLIICTIISGMIGIFLFLLKINLPLFLDSSFTALPFFMFGYAITRYTEILQHQKWDKYLPLISILLFIFVYYFAPFYSLKYNKLVSIRSIITMYPCGFFGTLGMIFIAKYIKYIPIIVWWGRYSIMILVIHKLYIYSFSYYTNAWIPDSVNMGLNFVFTMLLCSLCIPLFKKFLPHVTAQKDLIKI